MNIRFRKGFAVLALALVAFLPGAAFGETSISEQTPLTPQQISEYFRLGADQSPEGRLKFEEFMREDAARVKAEADAKAYAEAEAFDNADAARIFNAAATAKAKAEAEAKALSPAERAGLFSGVSTKCWESGSCNFCDGLIVFINAANAILALLAIVAVIFFVYGAGHLALSSGNENLVHKGKEAIKASIIGTLIVLGAWQIMAIVVMVMTNKNSELVNSPQQNQVNWVKNWYTAAQWCGGGKSTPTVSPAPTPATTPPPPTTSPSGGSGF